MTTPSIPTREWLEADGLGGFASGTSTGIRTRRYHALLLIATTPPTGRVVLVNGFDAWVETANGKFSLSSQCCAPDVIGGDGAQRIEAFGWEPWPHWIFKLEDGTRIELEIFAVKGEPMTCLCWKLLGPRKDVKLRVRPFLSVRCRGETRPRFLAALRRRSRRDGADQWRLCTRTELVLQLSLPGGASAG